MNILVAIFMILGGFFGFVAALGVLRFPDFFMRMHAATKAGAFGAAMMLIAATLHFRSLSTVVTSVLIIVFFYLTAPVAAQSLSEAAYRRKVKFWSKTGIDKLAGDEGVRDLQKPPETPIEPDETPPSTKE
jgi:multicomponent Na+:H+ antiporter subunit G